MKCQRMYSRVKEPPQSNLPDTGNRANFSFYANTLNIYEHTLSTILTRIINLFMYYSRMWKAASDAETNLSRSKCRGFMAVDQDAKS